MVVVFVDVCYCLSELFICLETAFQWTDWRQQCHQGTAECRLNDQCQLANQVNVCWIVVWFITMSTLYLLWSSQFVWGEWGLWRWLVHCCPEGAERLAWSDGTRLAPRRIPRLDPWPLPQHGRHKRTGKCLGRAMQWCMWHVTCVYPRYAGVSHVETVSAAKVPWSLLHQNFRLCLQRVSKWNFSIMYTLGPHS